MKKTNDKDMCNKDNNNEGNIIKCNTEIYLK